ncbi:DUF2913 family protein [Aliivibrio kagoshimensis]|uniref:DUF2913 family protein n=1 Tax=Aliivibrio kagoshimensis TaxID=2910230 RepID=UPI003D0F6E44
MKNQEYHQTFTAFITLTLLYLYCYIDIPPRFVSVKKHNELLIKFIKKRMALPDNASIKKDLKTLIMMARKGKNVELKLWELHTFHPLSKEHFSDTEHFYVLLTYLFEKHGFASALDVPEREREKGIIYTSAERVNHCFNDDNELTTPLPVYIIVDEPQHLVELINNQGDRL